MDTSLQSVRLTEDELRASLAAKEAEESLEEEQHHIHMPNPSLWPFILSAAVLFTIAGLLSLPDIPYLSIIAAPFVIVGILGWALEDPMAPPHQEEVKVNRFEGGVVMSVDRILEQAREVAERTVTVSSTAWSAHPVKVEIDNVVENEGVVLALYGKVELEAQRQELEDAVREVPGVSDVHNYITAEDAILNIANARLENLRAAGKLEGAKSISILVENYILSLYGEVPDSSMKGMLEREMIGIPGVRVVVNHIGLNKEIPGNLGRTRNKI
jgi:osmotically-inducible protein OsmY